MSALSNLGRFFDATVAVAFVLISLSLAGATAVVIPKDLVNFVAEEGAEHERMESWIVSEVEKGAKLPGLYPPNEENKKRYEEWKKSR